MVNKNILLARLERLTEYLDVLDKVLTKDIKIFLTDPFIYGTAERNMHLAIECVLDIGNHIIANRGYERPDSYADIFRILEKNNVISQNLYSNLEGVAAFRNLLVHDYLRLDRQKLYTIIKNKKVFLEDLCSVYTNLL